MEVRLFIYMHYKCKSTNTQVGDPVAVVDFSEIAVNIFTRSGDDNNERNSYWTPKALVK